MHPVEIDAIIKLPWVRRRPGMASGSGTLGVTPSQQYHEPGTYTVEVGAYYEDNNTDMTLGFPHYAAMTDVQMVVPEPAPEGVASISGATSTSEGTTYLLNDSFYDPLGLETPQQWTIAWGDGQSTVYQNDSSTFTHVYDTKGTMSIHADWQTQFADHTATWSVAVAGPTVSISGDGGAVYENPSQGPSYRDLVISRSLVTDRPLTVNLGIGGTANANEYALTGLSSGTQVGGSVTIPANTSFCTIRVSAREDFVPGWTDTLAVTVGPSAAYDVGSPSKASTEIVDGDLGITLGDGSGNIILDGSADGTQNLVPLVLKYPLQAKHGSVVALTDSQPMQNDVWATPSPGPGDQPVLGDVNGTYVSSVAWTYGTNDPAQQTFWVGGTGGSTSFDDVFTLSDSDAQATPPPTAPTSNTASTPAAGTDSIQIVPLNNPNGSNLTDWKGQTIPWLVGQMVAIKANVLDPELKKNAQFQWTVQDQNLTGRYTDEPADWSRRKVVTVTDDDGGKPLPNGTTIVHSGLKQQNLVYFWYGTSNATPGQAQSETVRVQITNSNLPAASVAFNVFTPQNQTSIYGGAAGADPNNFYAGLVPPANVPPNADPPLANKPGGIQFNLKVGTPQPPNQNVFKQGITHVVQLMNANRNWDSYAPFNGSKNTNVHIASKFPGQWILDENDPYGIQMVNGSRLNGPTDNQFTVQGVGWLTDDGQWHHITDFPHIDIFGINPQGIKQWTGADNISFNDAFQTYLMYQPSGNKPAGQITQWDSQWVPLAYTLWSYQFVAKPAGGQLVRIVGQPATSIGNILQATTNDPQWTQAATALTLYSTSPIPPR